ncbi:MAG: histidine phosphatase family protein [Chloroflexota bacterium]|nr:histidine phosphatase family protein [Chloroflexota bacterium]
MTSPGVVDSIAERLAAVPAEGDVALIVRHAERGEIPSGEFGADVPLTARGMADAQRLGAALRSVREQVSAVSSPVLRCVQTAEAVLRGGGLPGVAALDRMLGDPGPFVVDPEVSGKLFLQTGIFEIVHRQLSDAEPPPGMRPTAEGIELLLCLTTDNLGNQGRLNVYVTHDAVLSVLVATLFRSPLETTGWPQYLEGLLLWRTAGLLQFSWRAFEQASYSMRG